MAANREPEAGEVRITVDGAEFYSLIRAMKRAYRVSELGEVAITVRDGKMTVASRCGAGIFPCNNSAPVVARLPGGRFCSLGSLVTDAKATGPLVIVFRPEFGEVSLPYVGVKAKFDGTPEQTR